MAELAKLAMRGLPFYMWLILIVSAGLMIGGFILPPAGEIDPSVLKGAGILLGGGFGFGLLTNLPVYIERGARLKANISSSGINVEVHGDKDSHEE